MTKTPILVLGVVSVLASPLAVAGYQVTAAYDTKNYSSVHDSIYVGGEFRAQPNAELSWVLNYYKVPETSAAGQFQTFCLEWSEHFTANTWYNVALSGTAQFGSQPPDGDPISIGTAYLYSEFAKGTLNPYDYVYGSGRVGSAGNLQKMIWALEGEGSFTVAGEAANPFYAVLATKFGDNTAGWVVDANGAYNVAVMNLGSPGQVQDQLVMVPEAATYIAGLLLGLPVGVNALRFLRRRREV